MTIARLAALSVLFASLGSPVWAQDEDPIPQPNPDSKALPPYQAAWSSPQIAQLAAGLIGTWRTDAAIDSMAGADGSTSQVYLVMSVAAVPVDGMSDTLYVETARSDTPWTPYRRAIFQFYPYKDGIRLRTYELTVGKASDGVFDGMFAAAEHFPSLSRDELVATIDLDLTPSATGFTGKSPYPFPTGVGGAVEMTSTLSLEGDTLTVADRGFDANGKVVWGADEGGSYLFERSQGIASITRRDDGMVVIDYGGANGPIVSNGDGMHVHYEGFLKDKTRFDSSLDRGQPFVFPFPPGGRAITGWGIGMENLAQGARRKLIIPGYLGYGPSGNPRAGIPADATLYFNIHLLHLDRPEPQAAQPGEPAAQPAPAED